MSLKFLDKIILKKCQHIHRLLKNVIIQLRILQVILRTLI